MPEVKRLFMIYIGGAHEKSLIELHDIRFVISDTIENTYDFLRKSWWGKPSSLHLDAWGVVRWADGYDVVIQPEKPPLADKQLYFVNLGGYDSNQFTELHKNIFMVAANAHEAKEMAIKRVSDWGFAHKDYVFEVDNIINLNQQVCSQGYIQLTVNASEKPFDFICGYVPLNR